MLGNTISLPLQQNQGKEGKKKSSQNAHTNIQPQPSTSNSGTNQPWHLIPETQVQVGHTCSVQPVAVMIILRKIATRIISALGVGQNHMPHTCAEHQSEIIYTYTVEVHSIPQKIAPVSPMTTEKSPGQHHGIFTVRDPTTEQTPNIWDYHEETQEILQIQDRHIQTHHCLTETEMNRLGPDINKQGLMKGTTDNIHQITIISHLLQFLLQDLI